MALPEYLLDYLHIKRIAVATIINVSENEMQTYVVIFPIREIKEQKYYNNLAEIISYEIRLIKHKKIYTDENWGYDWDCVLNDKSTRIKRIFVNRTDDNYELESILTSLDIDINDFNRLRNYDSPVLDNVIDCYLEHPSGSPHLWKDF